MTLIWDSCHSARRQAKIPPCLWKGMPKGLLYLPLYSSSWLCFLQELTEGMFLLLHLNLSKEGFRKDEWLFYLSFLVWAVYLSGFSSFSVLFMGKAITCAGVLKHAHRVSWVSILWRFLINNLCSSSKPSGFESTGWRIINSFASWIKW